jgi:hypothetical protein
MICPHCRNPVSLTRQFCPHCGNRVEINYEEVSTTVSQEAARRRGRGLESYIRGALALAVLAAVALCGLNYLWDARLVYDGADVPGVEAPPVAPSERPSIPLAEHDLFRLNAPPGQAPRVYAYRFPPLRDELRAANGGSDAVAKAVRQGLRYLQGKQLTDGSWAVTTQDLRILKENDESATYGWAQTGVSALALLAFLGEGETWMPDAQGRRGPFADTARRAVANLVRGQDEVNGRFGPAEGNFMYNHGLATLAMAEAAGMSGDPFLRAAAQKGVDLIERTQGPNGGWDYKDQITGRQDSSVSSWQVQALLAARDAGLRVKPEALQKALAFYQEVTDPSSGLVRYDMQDKQLFASLSGVALMLRRWMGDDRDNFGVRALARKVAEYAPRAEKNWGKDWDERNAGPDNAKRKRTFDPYLWYFSTYGMFFQGGEEWTHWNDALTAALLELQDRDGAWRASDKWTVKAGAVYSTALSVLALQAYYRIP